VSTAQTSNSTIRKPVFWGDNEDSGISRAVDDEGTGVLERTAARSYGWDSGSLTWRRIAVNSAGEVATTGGGGSAGTQYTEGDTDASITGTALLWEGASDTLSTVSASTPLPVGGSVTANAGSNLNTSALALESGGNLAAAAASLSVLDDWDEADRAKVNLIAGQAGITAGAGNVAANTPRVCIASDQAPIEITGSASLTGTVDLTKPDTGTRSQVSDSATNVTILAANASRLGATVYNDSSAILYLGLGTTDVTTSNYTIKVASSGYYEVPYGYTGAIEGLWATDPNDGAARVTELTKA